MIWPWQRGLLERFFRVDERGRLRVRDEPRLAAPSEQLLQLVMTDANVLNEDWQRRLLEQFGSTPRRAPILLGPPMVVDAWGECAWTARDLMA